MIPEIYYHPLRKASLALRKVVARPVRLERGTKATHYIRCPRYFLISILLVSSSRFRPCSFPITGSLSYVRPSILRPRSALCYARLSRQRTARIGHTITYCSWPLKWNRFVSRPYGNTALSSTYSRTDMSPFPSVYRSTTLLSLCN